MVTSPCCNQLTCTSVSCNCTCEAHELCPLRISSMAKEAWSVSHVGLRKVLLLFVQSHYIAIPVTHFPCGLYLLEFHIVPCTKQWTVLLDTIFPASPSMNTTMLPEKLHEELTHAKDLVYSKNTWLTFISKNGNPKHVGPWMQDGECTCGILELHKLYSCRYHLL